MSYSLQRLPILAVFAVLTACATAPPQQPTDLCSIFFEKDDWYEVSDEAAKRWGVPIPVLLAFIYHESGFRADAQPPRTRILGFIPGPRPSSAYGYPQALDSTWDWYREATGNGGADRDDFADAVDFVGWYNHISHQRNGIAKTDAYRLYLAYHEGHGGYARGSYRGKAWLSRTARRVATSASRYQQQLHTCASQLEADSGWWPFS
jgi:hypothetical protein